VSFLDSIKDWVQSTVDRRIAENNQAVLDLNKKAAGGSADNQPQKGFIYDPFMNNEMVTGPVRLKPTYLSTNLLKIASRRDAIVGSIIHTRASEAAAEAKRQQNKYDNGWNIVPRSDNIQAKPEEIALIAEFIQNCGETKSLVKQAGEQKLTFDQFVYMSAVDMQRYGHMAVERLYKMNKRLRAFRPLAGESIYHAKPDSEYSSTQLENDVSQNAAVYGHLGWSFKDPAKSIFKGPVKYVQQIQNKTTAVFREEECLFWRLTVETDLDLQGYAIGPLERAIEAVSNHLKVENHQAMFFTHGQASRGVFVLNGAGVNKQAVDRVQAQWTQTTTGPANAWRTLVLGGSDIKADWIPITINNRDMEFTFYTEHLLRVLHSCFMIDPEQTGFGYLSKGTQSRTLGESQNEWKITASKERGLMPILGRIESLINEEILPLWSPDLASKYKFQFAGVDAETRLEEMQRLTAEVSLHKTIGEARKEAGLPPLPFGNGLVLNGPLLTYLEKNLPKGVFMETFVGVQGASQRPDLQYIPDAMWFNYQQMMMALAGVNQGGGEEGDDGEEEKETKKSQASSEDMVAAAQRYIESNPELFKAYKDNLVSAKRHTSSIDSAVNDMMKELDEAANRLVDEAIKAIAEDKGDSDGHDH